MILTDEQRRALTFIYAANQGGYQPIPAEVTEWVKSPEPARGRAHLRPEVFGMRDVARIQAQLAKVTSQLYESREPDETLADNLARLGWISGATLGGAGLILTALGRALLRSDADLTLGSEVTVLEGEDPLAWGSLVGLIADVGECLIVDPYLKPEQFLDIAKFTGTTRALIRRPKADKELIPMRVHQSLPDIHVDVKVADPSVLHDRYIIGETKVYTLGCSLNGVGRKPTTLVPHNGEVAARIREIAERWWDDAEPLGEASNEQ